MSVIGSCRKGESTAERPGHGVAVHALTAEIPACSARLTSRPAERDQR